MKRRHHSQAKQNRRPPTHEDIARRAFELYVERGQTPGGDQADWFQAEHELRGSSSREKSEPIDLGPVP